MKNKKIWAGILSLALIFACTFPALSDVDEAYAGEISALAISEPNTDWYTDSPGDTNFTINNGADLWGLSNIVNGIGIAPFDFSGKTITLSSTGGDIMMTGVAFPSIGSREHPFNGIFNGSTRKISNLQISSDRTQYVGMFGYAGSNSLIKNINVSGNITISAPTQIRYVGGIVGLSEGVIEGCNSAIKITLTSTMQADKDKPGMLRTIGGIAGQVYGDITDCTFDVHDGGINLTCTSNVTDQMGNVVGEVGGIVGISGDQSKLEETPTISSSTNSSDLNFNISGAGGKDRFGADLYAHSQAVGGIVGYSMGNIDSCVNEGIIYTGVKSSINMDTTTTTIKKPVAGFGAGATGGIVGSLRGNLFDDLSNSDTSTVGNPPYNYYRDKGGKSAGATATPPTVKITDCTNKGIVIGLSGVGGIIGSSTGWSEIEGCANKGDVMGTRWNKPFSGGIGGTVQSDIRYCYNRGDIYSTAGAGYYCAGISGGFESDNTTSTEGNERVAEPLLTGCYTTGQIYLDAAGYRSGILVGENTGIIQNNAFIPDITPDGKIVDTNSGTVTDTIETSEFVKEDLKSSKGIARLNTYAAGKGMWEMIYVEDIGNTNDGYPVLVRAGGDDSKMHLAGATILGGVAVLFEDAKYSTTIDPVPSVSIDSLHQNADYYVVPQEGTNGNDVSSTTYSASVIGMGKYKDTLTSSLSYKIKAAPIEECTIYADPVIFNWNIQRPSEDKVTLYDPSGGVVDSENYLVSDTYDASKGEKGYDIDPSPTHVEIAYYDYKNAHDRYWYYNIVVTAKGGANYEGTSTQKAWRIKSASMIPQRPESDPQYNPLSPESVVYGKTYFDINQNGNIEENEKFDTLKGTDDKTGDAIKIPYTGSVIYPRVESLTFKNILLREATNFDYIANPTSFDYKYVYGNPNPEIDDGKNAQPINVSKPGKPETMTIRFTSGSNFENYNNVFYQIVPADISLVSAGSIPAQAYTGNAISPSLSLKYNGITLKKGTDYTVTYSNNIKSGSSAKAVITGTGNFTGSKTILFKINPPKVGWQLISGKWYYNNSSGVALKGWLYDGGKWYLLHKTTGHMLSGWQQDGSIWYLLHNTSGHMLTGWQYDGSNWYYLASSGAMKTGWYYDGSNWYYLASSGAMKTGWHYDGSNWYYLDSSGAMRTGWLQISNKWYYLNSSGAMVTGTQKIGSKKYKFNSSGVWVK